MSELPSAHQQPVNYFNLHIEGLGYLSNIRKVEGNNGSFLSCVINALSGTTENPNYTRFDITVMGKETNDLVKRCMKAIDEERKILIGFKLSNLQSDIFTLAKGEYEGEQRVSLRARLIKIHWIKIGQETVYKNGKKALIKQDDLDHEEPMNGSF